MESTTMGRVVTDAVVENLGDLVLASRGALPDSDARRVTIHDALVDAGATTLALPASRIRELGLNRVSERRATTSAGLRQVNVYEAVRLTLLERFCTVDVLEVPDDVPALIGQVPLEMLDLVVDPQGRRLTTNPAHGGEHVLELY